MRTRPGIPTSFEHTNFRSRLEARWAAFFDLIGWRWTYEPLDASGYIPDFLIRGDRPLFVEVGPCVTRQDYEDKASKAAAAAGDLRQDVLVVGVDPILPGEPGSAAGWFGEYTGPQVLDDPEAEHGYVFGAGVWTTCEETDHPPGPGCGRVGVAHDFMSFAVRPCGHYPGGHIHPVRVDIERLWREAGNRTQWRAA